MAVLKLQAEYVMAGIICHLSEKVSLLPEILTDALGYVFAEAPSELTWSRCTKSLGCYVAEHSNANNGSTDVYAINLVSGTSLCNGRPPSHLPSSIVGHALYRAVFPNREFDVKATVMGDTVTYRTVDAIHGCFYSFCLRAGQLNVTETCNAQDLELLPRAS
jgi:hypothetical protein